MQIFWAGSIEKSLCRLGRKSLHKAVVGVGQIEGHEMRLALHNACSEALFSSLKMERLHGQRFQTIREAKDEVIAWLLWYNRTRMHSTLKYVSPMQFEQNWADAALKIAA